jgi:acetyl esterase
MSAGCDVRTEDVVYRKGQSGDLLARLYLPGGDGPFPAVVSVHGGRWVSQSRLTNEVIDATLARAGIVVMAIDFRMPPAAKYPEPIADINFAIRWLKHMAGQLKSNECLVGGLGTSSGGHQTMLNAMRPRDPRYFSMALPGSAANAELAYVVACWPVLDPLARYAMAKQKNMERHIQSHDAYWPDEETMGEGNPQLILERGEPAFMPPALLIQGTGDKIVPPEMSRRFADAYQARGGSVTLRLFDGQPHTFITKNPEIAASREAIDLITSFVLEQAERIGSARSASTAAAATAPPPHP